MEKVKKLCQTYSHIYNLAFIYKYPLLLGFRKIFEKLRYMKKN